MHHLAQIATHHSKQIIDVNTLHNPRHYVFILLFRLVHDPVTLLDIPCNVGY